VLAKPLHFGQRRQASRAEQNHPALKHARRKHTEHMFGRFPPPEMTIRTRSALLLTA